MSATEVPTPTDEEERLAALRAFAILDTDSEEAFDALVEIASEVCGTSMALVTFIDEERQWFKARKGLDASDTPREHAFCAHAIMDRDLLVVPDATLDARFRDNPFVVADPHIRFYAGAPITTDDGHGLGTLCVVDTVPRTDDPLTESQRRVLEALASQAVRLLELRRVSKRLADALSRVKTLEPLVPVCAWCRKIRDDEEYWGTLEEYLHNTAGVDVSHGICPTCESQFGAR